MDDLLQSQIKESCKLALPNGLKELMSDISREVLRAQPKNLYGFIEKYLAALLVTRENLSVAGRLCQEVCDPACHPELEDELRHIFYDEEDLMKAKKLIQEHFEAGRVKESNLMMKLLRRFSIPQDNLEQVQDVVRRAFLNYHVSTTDAVFREIPAEVDDEVTHAALHTMQLYAATGPSKEDYDQKAKKIQAAYRAYGVRRFCTSKPVFERKMKHHIRFSTEAFEMDIASKSSKTDMPETIQTVECESVTVHKTESQMVLSEAEMSHDKVARQERMLSQISYDMKYPERVQSFINYEDEKEKRVTSVTDDAIANDAEDVVNNAHDRKASNISEVHFSEPLIVDNLLEETIDDNELDDDVVSFIDDDDDVVFYQADATDDQVDDQAVNADESDGL